MQQRQGSTATEKMTFFPHFDVRKQWQPDKAEKPNQNLAQRESGFPQVHLHNYTSGLHQPQAHVPLWGSVFTIHSTILQIEKLWDVMHICKIETFVNDVEI